MYYSQAMDGIRKIIHVDMDAFYASVEQRDYPQYQGKPIAVGSSPTQRGVVCAASYEARVFGIHSAMPSKLAIQRCPHLIFVKPRFEVYRTVSEQIRAIFERYTDLIEPVALDEAYLDVTESKSNLPYASAIAREIRASIQQETGLTASAGVSFNKFLAKMATGMNKPNGSTVILPDQAEALIEQLAIEKFHGIGKVSATRMRELGICTGADLKQRSETELVQQFGKMGHHYFKIARGQDDRIVEANRVRKSLGAETSFAQDLTDRAVMLHELATIAQDVCHRLEQHQAKGRTLTLKVKFGNYQQITRSRTLLNPICELGIVTSLAQELFEAVDLEGRSVRLLGISLSNLGTSHLGSETRAALVQLALF
ncbi:DNA polymerase IV [Leptolyngbya boryana]|nr:MULTISPECIES: DNA polymerase IV [Leptolyngbya]ULP30924.1 DNA polymerase IV [Leptolyngbya boryana IU 594]BAS59683.1 nucleotidyltransferase/DNA polymerase [Leptolyngbya boryana IAM M-101]BAS66031.1 nucleotidyltransferase/DNA polymerase [Leptolyngbya boryana dg5]